MWNLLSRFFLICHFSLIFSLSILCSIFFIRTRDKIVLRILIILYSLFLHALASLFYYLFADEFGALFGNLNSALSLFLLVITSVTVPLIIYGTTSYMLSLLDLSQKIERIGRRIITFCSLIFFLFGLYIIVFLNGNNWVTALSRALNELFLYGSMFLFFSSITALVFIGKTSNREKKRLLRGIIISFMPIPLFAVIDLIWLLKSPYKLVFISFFTFSILLYLFTSKHYIHRYDPEDINLQNSSFYKSLDISKREQELIPLLLEGISNKEISEKLFISPNTVKTHIRNIYKKAEVSNRLQLLSKLRYHP